ncbi:MAG: peptidoglycan-binding protein [Lachnospiraceae bacterium]|nr:peptidoglycan-binding protein [Lachnospiraceae bacterium]
MESLRNSCGSADGHCGGKTKKAIKKFQRKKGMTVNGKINKKLLNKLKIKI